MASSNMSDVQMRTALRELEQASYNHDQWAELIFGTLICHLTPDQRDIEPDAHKLCRFGQWYYASGIAELDSHPGIAEIGVEHLRMHQYAASLLRSAKDNIPISIQDFERFVTAVKRLRLEIATVQHELQDSLYNLDPLTGTPSRVGMLTKLRDEQELVKRRVHSCAVAMMDLDHFKTVNDTHGHIAGDAVLIAFARYVMAHLRPYDKVFRYGGEEFLICLPDTEPPMAFEVVDRLRTELGSLPNTANGSPSFQVTVSFGLAALDPDVPVELSIDRADRALYVAKANGRNQTVMWDVSMSEAPGPA